MPIPCSQSPRWEARSLHGRSWGPIVSRLQKKQRLDRIHSDTPCYLFGYFPTIPPSLTLCYLIEISKYPQKVQGRTIFACTRGY